METMIVEISVPAINRTFDFQLPAGGLVQDVTAEVIRILEQSQPGLSFDREYPVMCHLDDGRLLNPEDSLASAGLYDGVRLMLL